MVNAVVRRVLLAFFKEHLGDSVHPCIHMKIVAKSRVIAVCSNNLNWFVNILLSFSALWTAGLSWSIVCLWFVKPNVPPNPLILGANLLYLFQETPALRKLVLTILLLCSIGSIKSGLGMCVPLLQKIHDEKGCPIISVDKYPHSQGRDTKDIKIRHIKIRITRCLSCLPIPVESW